jgi:tellurite resistance protein
VRKAGVLSGLAAHGAAELIMVVAVVVWAVLIALYSAKWFVHRASALAEARHPVQCCFIALVPVSTMLIALAVAPYGRSIAVALLAVGAAGQVAFGVIRAGELWQGGRAPAATTPVLYLPGVAGNFVSAIVAGTLGYAPLATLFFGAGLLYWFALESVILHRLYVVEPLAEPLRPTLGIQLAPPAVGCVAYLAITSGPPDLFAQLLYGYAVLQGLFLIRLLPWIWGTAGFTPGYWGFTFGLTALSTAGLRFIDRGYTGPVAWLALPVFVFASAVVGAMSVGTVVLLFRKRLLASPVALVAASQASDAAPTGAVS